MSIHRKSFSGRTGDTTGCAARSASRGGEFLALAALVSPPMGSSGSKKTPEGQARQHLAKVGTPAENSHTLHAAERDVVGNFGVHGKGLDLLGRRGRDRPIIAIGGGRHAGPALTFSAGNDQARSRAQFRLPIWSVLPSTSAGVTSSSGSVTTSPSRRTPPCSILRRPSLFDGTAVGNARRQQPRQADPAVAQLGGVGRDHELVDLGPAPRGPGTPGRTRPGPPRRHRRRGTGRRPCGPAGAWRRPASASRRPARR